MRSQLPTREDFRSLATLAFPVAFVQLGLMAMGVVDTMIVGHLSGTALAGVAIGSVYVFALGSFGMGMLTALDPVISQAVGAGDAPAIARGFQRGVVLAVAMGLATAFVLIPVRPVLVALGQPPALVAVAVPYVQLQIPSMLGFYLFVLFRQCLQAVGITRPAVVTIVLANALNAVLCWAFVFGRLGAPALGPVGAGLATLIARWTLALLLLGFGWRHLRPWFAWSSDVVRWAPFARLLQLGLPIAIQYELEYAVFATVALLMGRISETAAAAHQIAINIASLTFMVPLGISSAGAVRVGQAVGAGDASAARRAALAALTAGVGFMMLSACMLLRVPRVLALAYTSDAGVAALASVLIPIAGVFQVFDGIQVVSIGVLRGVGDTRTPLFVNLIGYWAVGLPISLWVGFRMGLGPPGLWWGLVAGLAMVALVLLVRVRVRLWRSLERLVIEDARG